MEKGDGSGATEAACSEPVVFYHCQRRGQSDANTKPFRARIERFELLDRFELFERLLQ